MIYWGIAIGAIMMGVMFYCYETYSRYLNDFIDLSKAEAEYLKFLLTQKPKEATMANIVFKPFEDSGSDDQIVRVRVDESCDDDGSVDIVLCDDDGGEIILLTIHPEAGIQLHELDEEEAESAGIMVDAQGYPIVKTE